MSTNNSEVESNTDQNSDSESSSISIDEDTSQLNSLSNRVNTYEELSNEDKLKSIEEYTNILSLIKECSSKVSKYKEELQTIENLDIKSKKSVSNETYTATLDRFNDIKIMVEESSVYTLKELLSILKEIKKIKQILATYLNKQLEVVTL